MSDRIHIICAGPPVAKGRPRMNMRTGNVYTAQGTAKYERHVAQEAALVMNGRKPFDCAVMLAVQAYFPIPKSWSKAKREAALHHTGRPDADNILKAIGDALNGIVYRDDALAVEAYVRKRYDKRPRVEITVQPMP